MLVKMWLEVFLLLATWSMTEIMAWNSPSPPHFPLGLLSPRGAKAIRSGSNNRDWDAEYYSTMNRLRNSYRSQAISEEPLGFRHEEMTPHSVVTGCQGLKDIDGKIQKMEFYIVDGATHKRMVVNPDAMVEASFLKRLFSKRNGGGLQHWIGRSATKTWTKARSGLDFERMCFPKECGSNNPCGDSSSSVGIKETGDGDGPGVPEGEVISPTETESGFLFPVRPTTTTTSTTTPKPRPTKPPTKPTKPPTKPTTKPPPACPHTTVKPRPPNKPPTKPPTTVKPPTPPPCPQVQAATCCTTTYCCPSTCFTPPAPAPNCRKSLANKRKNMKP